jgi:hypothetical protein
VRKELRTFFFSESLVLGEDMIVRNLFFLAFAPLSLTEVFYLYSFSFVCVCVGIRMI